MALANSDRDNVQKQLEEKEAEMAAVKVGRSVL